MRSGNRDYQARFLAPAVARGGKTPEYSFGLLTYQIMFIGYKKKPKKQRRSIFDLTPQGPSMTEMDVRCTMLGISMAIIFFIIYWNF